MCSRGVSNGPWRSLPPPFPFHFLITSPLPSLTGAQTRLSLRYFHLPLHPTLPGSSMTPQQQEMGICSTRFSLPHSSSEHTHLEQVTDHFEHLECGEAITLPSGHLQLPTAATASCTTTKGLLLYYLPFLTQWETPVVVSAQISTTAGVATASLSG